ncbi:MAG: cyclic nucleotide-binding domain-containing protein [Anaerolineae bacterium]|nr:cyclic nucleotide-binding domain-containing protein [Anaerolineae bacterium]
MELAKLLRSVEMFAGLAPDDLQKLASIFVERHLQENEVIFHEGDIAESLFLVMSGFIEVVKEDSPRSEGRVLVNLGPGQSVGEMSLIDHGLRSATVRASTSDTVIASVSREAFDAFCESNTLIGYRVMRNIAADLSFRLRHKDLQNAQAQSGSHK